MDLQWYVYGAIALGCLFLYFAVLVIQYKVLVNVDKEFNFTPLNFMLGFIGISSLFKALTVLGW